MTGIHKLAFAGASVALCASPSFAALSVRDEGGALSVWRNGRVLVSGIAADCGNVASNDARSSFAEHPDGTRVWNRWSEDPSRRFRLEVADRADGAVEITLMGEADALSDCRRRRIHLDLPDAALLGKTWRRVSQENSGAHTRYGEEDGVFSAGMKPFVTRFLASDGVVYDFNPLGPGDESGAILWSDAGNQLNNNGVGGYWQIERRDGGFRFSCGGEIKALWGGFAGGKIVIREGAFSEFDRLHAIRTFHYPTRLQPTRLVAFGAPKRGEKYADGDVFYGADSAGGWLDGTSVQSRKTVVGHPEGVRYSCVAGKGKATYRLGGLVDGWHVFTFEAGNYAGTENTFSVTANGDRLFANATIPKRSVRRLSKAIHVKNGRLDIELDGDWIVSAIGDQALLADGEDFSVSRGFWVADGYEPCTLFRNADTKASFVPKLRDETDVLPVPGSESAAKRRAVPMPVERPAADDPRLAWAKTAKMERLLANSVSMSEFDRPGSLETYADQQLVSKGIGVVMLSGMHSRHTYPNHLERGVACVRHICDVLHKRGIKVIDHHDATLLWNFTAGFRVMMERLDQTAITRDAGLPSWQFCPSDPTWTAAYYAYLRKLVAAGVDGLQIDELEYWSLGCLCHDCREAFRRDTGWEVPLNECDADFNNPDSMLRHVWHDWRKKALTNWFVGLRRFVKDLRDDFILSCYTTNDAFCFPNQCRYVSSDIQDLGRVMNYFGSEMMSRSALRDGRNLLSVLRMRSGVAPEGVPPLWIWWYNVDYANEYFAWALSSLIGQTPLLSAVPMPAGGAQFEAFGASAAAMNRDGAEPVAEVAILFPTYSRDWNGDWKDRTFRREMFGTAQTLDTMHIPYRFVSDQWLERGNFGAFKALFVGDAQCLSAAEIASIKAFADRGGKVRMMACAGTRDELGAPRPQPAFAPNPNIIVTEEARAAPFDQWETWNTCIWTFDPDKKAEAAFKRELLDWCGGARTWKIDAPEKVFTGVWREKTGDYVVHFVNATGVNMKPGEKVVSDAPDPAFPAVASDMAITVPASIGTKAVAVSPDFSGEVALTVRKNNDGTVTAILPKERLSVYTLVRFCAWDTPSDVPGAVSLVAAADGREDIRCCGAADIASGRRMTPDTLFWIASNTKAMAAAVMLTLVDEGAVKLDDAVDAYLPEFKDLQVEDASAPGGVRPAKTRPTIRQLLSHTSGLKFFPTMPIDRWPMRLLASKAARTPQLADPGTRYRYSNWGIDVAMAVAEVVTGTTWDALLKERILIPLGMSDTTFFPTAEQRARLAVSYRSTEGNPLQAITVDQLQYPYTLHTRYPEAGGGLFSTAHDVAAFYRMIARNGLAPDGRRILSERMIATLAKDQTPASLGQSYSFGLRVNGSRLGHGGAYGTFAEVDRATGVVRVYLTQITGDARNAVMAQRFADWQRATATSTDGGWRTEGLGAPKM